MSAPAQGRLALVSPDQHGLALHAGRRHGVVLLWQKQAAKGAWKKVTPQDDLAQALSTHAKGEDRFFSVNQFSAWRLVRHLRSLRALYVDLDRCGTVGQALYACDDAGLPAPSYAVASGNGVHLYWVLDPIPASALPVWQACQRKLIAALEGVGADRAAADCTRVLRLAGTVNSKNGAEVLGYVVRPGARTLHELADDILGLRETRTTREKKASVSSLEPVRAEKRLARIHRATGTFQLWHSRYKDLCTIADFHSFMGAGVPAGTRDKLLFLLANALSWFTTSDSLEAEVNRVAATYTPGLSPEEVAAYMAPIITRAKAAEQGAKVAFGGGEVDPRYHFKTETIRDWLGPLLTAEVAPKLKVLLPSEALQARKRTRDAGRWANDRATYLATFVDSENATRPWEALGISRATYFRRKSAGSLPSVRQGSRSV